MPPFSASDAALEGFQVIRRHWRVVAGWAGFNLLALIMMVVVTVVLLVGIAAATGGGPAGQAVSGTVGAIAAFLGTVLAQAIIVGGIYRLLLRPQEPAFLHLRLGRDELRLLAVWAIWLVAFAALATITFAIARAAGGTWAALAGLGGAIAAVYLTLRIALAAPISFAERRIDVVRAWRLSRGRVGALLGMALLSACLIGLVVLTAWIVLLLVIGLTSGFQGIAAMTQGAEAFRNHPGPYLLHAVAEILFAPVIWVLSQAPLVAAYRALAAPEKGPADQALSQ